MSRDVDRLPLYLEHILDAIVRIYKYIEDVSEVEFLKNHLVQDAVIRNLEKIGEASKRISEHYPNFVKEHPELPLSFACGMRNVLIHGYDKVDLEVVWKTIENDLPVLYDQIKALVQLA